MLRRKYVLLMILKVGRKNKAEVSIASAKYDLNIARELFKIGISLAWKEQSRIVIESNPDNAMNEENSGFVIDKDLASIRFDEDLVVKPAEDESIPLLDLTEAE